MFCQLMLIIETLLGEMYIEGTLMSKSHNIAQINEHYNSKQSKIILEAH